MILQAIQDIIVEELEEMNKQIAANIQSEGLTASGQTASSLIVERTGEGAMSKGRAAFGTTEHGRKPGSVPTNMVDIIKKWIQDKGISVIQVPYIRQASANWQPKYTVAERSLQMAASAISYKIKKEGTALYRSGGNQTIYTPAIQEAISRIEMRIAELVSSKAFIDEYLK